MTATEEKAIREAREGNDTTEWIAALASARRLMESVFYKYDKVPLSAVSRYQLKTAIAHELFECEQERARHAALLSECREVLDGLIRLWLTDDSFGEGTDEQAQEVHKARKLLQRLTPTATGMTDVIQEVIL